jgi:hypothetical protein
MSFLPTGYSQPTPPKNYLRFQKGDTAFRIIGPATLGWEYWIEDAKGRKPVRLAMGAEKPEIDGVPDQDVKHFWAFPVLDYLECRVMLLEITQRGVQKAIKQLVDDPAWGDPTGYDIVVKRTGDGMDTEYSTMARPPKPLPKDIQDECDKVLASIDMDALFRGDDPFSK